MAARRKFGAEGTIGRTIDRRLFRDALLRVAVHPGRNAGLGRGTQDMDMAANGDALAQKGREHDEQDERRAQASDWRGPPQ